ARTLKPIIHLMRERRACLGELVQIDGSPHAWFELRGLVCTLLVYIDDATGKLLWLQFVPSETTNAYFEATKRYLALHGKPIAFYSDKHGVFRVNTTKGKSAATEDTNGLTQFGRAMDELDIETIFANSPQAKGRVERVNQTLQDRLVKELRLKGICTMEDGNVYLPEYMEEFNSAFSVVPRSSIDMHRPLTNTDDLDAILVQQQERILSKQLTLSYGRHIYQIETDHPTYAMRHARVIVREANSGAISIHYHGKKLEHRIMQERSKAAIVDSKHINNTVDAAIERMWTKPSPTHPWKQPQMYW
ncbi:MAG: ISNCY family transposase, partial [Patescibacteria group bacterium]